MELQFEKVEDVEAVAAKLVKEEAEKKEVQPKLKRRLLKFSFTSEERLSRFRKIRWDSHKDIIKRQVQKAIDSEGFVDEADIHRTIQDRLRVFSKETALVIDDMVFVLLDKENPTEEEVENVISNAKVACNNSGSIAVCSQILEASDFIIYANEKIGTTGLKKEKRVKLKGLSEELASVVGRRLSQFSE